MNWYYLENGAQRGPVTEAEFPALFQTGVINPGTYLWHEGMADWKTYGELLGALPPPTSTSAPAAATALPAAGSSRLRPEDAVPATERGTQCSQCGAVVSTGQLMRIGSASLCPKCQVAYRRQAHVGFGDVPPEYANPFVRLAAAILDSLICSAVVVALLAGAPFVARRFFSETAVRGSLGIGFVLCLLWLLDYFIGRIARDGATPAMKLFRIRVVARNGAGMGLGRAMGRFLMIGLTDSVTFGLGHLTVFFNQQRRSLPDIVCGTIVTKR